MSFDIRADMPPYFIAKSGLLKIGLRKKEIERERQKKKGES